MDRLWTPWRFDYIRNIGHSETGCVFCRIRDDSADEANFVLYRSSDLFVLLNLFPYTSGHLLIVAGRHFATLDEAAPAELHAMVDAARLCERALRTEYKPDGFNLGFNVGRAAGAGVEHHLHMHVLPRWAGDANFISVVGETRVLPEELPRTYARLLRHFRS